MNYPPQIFKYYNIDKLFDVLNNNNLWFSRICDYNDPFENRFAIPQEPSHEELKELYDEFIKKGINHFDAIYKGDISQFAKLFKEDNDKFMHAFFGDVKEKLNSWGICCFSAINNNTLMWSHYANSHKGVCLEFESYALAYSKQNENKNIGITVLDEVTYQSEFPIIKLKSIIDGTCIFDIRKISVTKSKDWEYEKEVRMFSDKVGLHYFNPKCLSAIYLGARITQKDKQKVLRCIERNKKLQHIKIIEMEIGKTDYIVKPKNNSQIVQTETPKKSWWQFSKQTEKQG
jgi:hypothetical protein